MPLNLEKGHRTIQKKLLIFQMGGSTTKCLAASQILRWFVDAVQKSTADWQIVVMPGHSLSGKPSSPYWTIAVGFSKSDKIEKFSHSWVDFALSLCDDCTYISSFAANIRHLHSEPYVFKVGDMFGKTSLGPGEHQIPYLLLF